MDISHTPAVLIEGTNPGAGTTTVAAVLADLAAEQHRTHVLDLSNNTHLRVSIRLNHPDAQLTYQHVAGATETRRDHQAAMLHEAMTAVPASEICFLAASSLDWHLRHKLEEAADLRIVVMEPSVRGSRATASWLNDTPVMPTLVVVNALANGTHGTLPRRLIATMEENLEHPYPLMSIRKSVAILPPLRTYPPLIEMIRRHPMLDDYREVWAHIASVALPH